MNTNDLNMNVNNNGMCQTVIDMSPKVKHQDGHGREAEKAEKERKAQEWQEFLDREAEKQNSFAEGMRVTVPAASLERNRDKEAFVITRIRRKAADNGGNASLTVKSELTGIEKDINGSDVSEILPTTL